MTLIRSDGSSAGAIIAHWSRLLPLPLGCPRPSSSAKRPPSSARAEPSAALCRERSALAVALRTDEMSIGRPPASVRRRRQSWRWPTKRSGGGGGLSTAPNNEPPPPKVHSLSAGAPLPSSHPFSGATAAITSAPVQLSRGSLGAQIHFGKAVRYKRMNAPPFGQPILARPAQTAAVVVRWRGYITLLAAAAAAAVPLLGRLSGGSAVTGLSSAAFFQARPFLACQAPRRAIHSLDREQRWATTVGHTRQPARPEN